MSIPKVGIVTVTYNSGIVLDDFLASLDNQDGIDIHLYAVDNASDDDSIKRLGEVNLSFPVSILANAQNLGVAVGNNQGIVEALQDECDWILLLNNDTFFSETAIRDLILVAERNQIDVLSPTIQATSPMGTIWYAGGKIHKFRGMQVKHPKMGAPLSAAPLETRITGYASTCVLLVRPVVFDEVGLMDPVYFVYGDDVDFCLRAQALGKQYWVSGDVLFSHKASSLTGEFTAPFAVRWISRNWVVVARRHCTALELVTAHVYMHVWAIARLLTRRDSLRGFEARLAAFREGRQVNLDSDAPEIGQWVSSHGGSWVLTSPEARSKAGE